MRISDGSSDVCSSDLDGGGPAEADHRAQRRILGRYAEHRGRPLGGGDDDAHEAGQDGPFTAGKRRKPDLSAPRSAPSRSPPAVARRRRPAGPAAPTPVPLPPAARSAGSAPARAGPGRTGPT